MKIIKVKICVLVVMLFGQTAMGMGIEFLKNMSFYSVTTTEFSPTSSYDEFEPVDFTKLSYIQKQDIVEEHVKSLGVKDFREQWDKLEHNQSYQELGELIKKIIKKVEANKSGELNQYRDLVLGMLKGALKSVKSKIVSCVLLKERFH